MQADVVAEFVAQTTAQAEQRRVLFEFACDLVPFEPDVRIRVLDIGAGYGAFAATVLDRFPNATAVGLDISTPMMAVGRERMAHFGDRFSYQVGDLAAGELPADLWGSFDVAVTSAFVLHLSREAKQRLFAGVYRLLNAGGCFFNVDLIGPANEEMEEWYRERGPEGTPGEHRRHGDQREPPLQGALPSHHHFEVEAHHPHYHLYHHVETEADQLAFLRAAGFVRVDCFYKRLRQAVIGGYKPSQNG
jgi:SAM-dependent methyltransferase